MDVWLYDYLPYIMQRKEECMKNGWTERIAELEAENQKLRDDVAFWKARWTELDGTVTAMGKRLEEKESELAANASMLARQCDLARQAEIDRDEARRRLAGIELVLKKYRLAKDTGITLSHPITALKKLVLDIEQAIKGAQEGVA
jgi:hypothetical protein